MLCKSPFRMYPTEQETGRHVWKGLIQSLTFKPGMKKGK